jgi:tRNA threonylcarbamoyladenosine biosynthesis protein TsaE
MSEKEEQGEVRRTVRIRSLDEMDSFAARFLEDVRLKNVEVIKEGALVVCLSGDLGSGKTTFSQCVARHLGITEKVTSPTFVIEKVYKTADTETAGERFETLVHIDAYRLENGSELNVLGFKSLLGMPRTLVLIEWPERVSDVLPTAIIQVSFEFVDEATRVVTY